MPKSAHSSFPKPDAQRGPVTRSQSRTTPNSEDLAASPLSRTRQRKKMAGEEKNGILPSESASHVATSGAESHLDIPAGPMRPGVPSSASAELKRKRQLEDEELDRRNIVLWWSPFRTTYYFLLECFWLVREYGTKFVRSRLILPFALVSALIFTAYSIQGPHQPFVSYFERKLLYCLYWIGLGVLSSIGLGTGLHTFILYLGPHIASVTLAAYECGTLKFPQPPYPDEILCPESETLNPDFVPSLWNIMSKVRLESFMWGLGTAIGELPPYFMARAARLSGKESEELVELQALLEDKQDNLPLDEGTLNLKRQRWRSFIQRRVRRAALDLSAAGTPVPEISIVEKKVQPSFMDRGKIFMEQLVARVGFFGILLGASIPNPLFDLAGITCGHFLVPFSTFFGATLIGKAVIKMHIQMIFVIITFSEKHVEHIIRLLKHIPKIGPHLQQPFLEFLQKQKTNLHRKPGAGAHHTQQSWLQWAFEKLVIVMVIYFVLSIVNSLAQSYHRRITKANQKPVYVAPKGKLQE